MGLGIRAHVVLRTTVTGGRLVLGAAQDGGHPTGKPVEALGGRRRRHALIISELSLKKFLTKNILIRKVYSRNRGSSGFSHCRPPEREVCLCLS